MILASDIHIRNTSEDVVFDKVFPGLLEATNEYNDKEIGFLGDIWHFRHEASVRLLNKFLDTLNDWTKEGINVHILPGNHDQIDVNGRNALELFDGVAKVYTNPEYLSDEYIEEGGRLWLPYRKNKQEIIDALDLVPKNKRKTTTVFYHGGLLNAWMNDCIRDPDGLPPEVFKEFKIVLLGHYHARQDMGNCHYIGSPYQTRSDESGQDKGYAIWDGDKFTRVTTKWGKRYHRVELKPGQELDLSDVDPNDEVRVKTATGVNPEDIGKQLAAAGIENHVVTPIVETMQTRLDVHEDASVDVYAKAFVDQVETDLDKDKLMSVYQNLA